MMNFILVEQTTIMPVKTDHHYYSLDDAAHLTGLHPDMLRYYCRAGLLGVEKTLDEREENWKFDDDTLYEIRRVEHCRWLHGVNFRALPLVIKLMRRIDDLDREVRFLRDTV